VPRGPRRRNRRERGIQELGDQAGVVEARRRVHQRHLGPFGHPRRRVHLVQHRAVGGDEEVEAGHAGATERLVQPSRRRADGSLVGGVDRGRHREAGGAVVLLRGAEHIAGRHRDLERGAEAQRRAVPIAEDGDVDLAAGDVLLDQHRIPEHPRAIDGVRKTIEVGDHEDPVAGSTAAGFTTKGGSRPATVSRPRPGRDDAPARRRDPQRRGDQLRGVLVHPQGAGTDRGSGRGHSAQIEQPRDRAVLAPFAVQHRERDIAARDQLDRAMHGQHGVLLVPPRTVLADGERDRDVRQCTDSPRDAGRGLEGDRVLVIRAASDDGDPAAGC
jgi:hypothetical protein